MGIPQPVYEFIRAPRLSSWDQAALITWTREWEQYVTKMQHRCNVTGENLAAVVATVKGSIDSAVLETLATFVLKKRIDEIEDSEVMALVYKRCRTLKNEYIPDVKTLFKRSLKMDMSIDDCDARVFQYFQDFTKIVEDNGLQALIGSGNHAEPGYRDRMKARCTLLIENVQPAMLREQIERLIKFERRSCKTDDAALFDLILEHAKVQQRFHTQTMERASPAPPVRPHIHQVKKAPHAARPVAHAGGKKIRLPPRDGCLVCKGQHWLDECPTATQAQRIEALSSMRASKILRSDIVRSKAVSAGPRGCTVRINGVLEVPYIPDSGADRCIVPRAVVDALLNNQPRLPVQDLPSPVHAVMADGHTAVCRQGVSLALELVTAAGPVRLKDTPCLILESEVDEFLLGNDAMKALGIDVESMIEQLAAAPLLEEETDEFPVGDMLPEPEGAPISFVDLLVDDAFANGMDTRFERRLRELVHKFSEVFRESLEADPPALVEPLEVTLREDSKPFRCKPRKYAPLQSQFLRQYTAYLEECGLVRKNNSAKWACAAVPVRKPGSQTDFRITIDYRPVNKMTVPIAGAMPNLSVISAAVYGSTCFAKFDLMKGFWQLPLHPASQEIMSFMTEDTVYTPLRVPQGAVDSAIHFQMQMQAALSPMLQRNVLVWIDDIIVFAPTIEGFLHALQEFFTIMRDRRFKLNASKSSLFQPEVMWCGKLLSGAGVRHDPARVDALTALPLPTTVAELQYFVCASNWLHESLPDYARVVAPLLLKLDAERKRIGRRNKNALNVAVDWSTDEAMAYNTVKQLIQMSIPLAFPSHNGELCVFTDASLSGWSIVITTVEEWNDNAPIDQQHHQMVICKGGSFKNAQLNWAIVEKEAFPIVKACSDLAYLLQRPGGFRLFCDHANLIYIFAPHVELKRHVRDRLQRWAMRLCGLRFTIEHISGEMNVWADIISRWRETSVIRAGAVRTRSIAPISPIRPLSDQSFEFPTLVEISKTQNDNRTGHTKMPGGHTTVDGISKVGGKIWIPPSAKNLLTRLFVVAHCGSQGHRSELAMFTILNERFHVQNLHRKVQLFVSKCLLCKHVKGPRIITRVYGPTYTAIRRNEAVHWDFLYLGEAYGGDSYVLVLKDSLTHYCELFACSSASSSVAADALLSWHKRYGCPETLISDQGTHFRNAAIAMLCARLKVQQRFTPVYSPWLNGTVERLNRDVLQVLRVLLLEYKLDHHEWPYLLPVVQGNLNQTPVASLAGKCPMELFLALPPPTSLDVIARPDGTFGSIDWDRIEQWLTAVRASMQQMHREVVNVKERKRLRDMAAATRATANFDIGDYVLWSRVDQRLTVNKLLAQWVGPFMVTEARPHSFLIRHLLTGAIHEVHGSRLRFYADSSLNVTQEIKEFVSNQGILLGVDRFSKHRYNETLKRWELLVTWTGLQDIEASWEPLTEIFKHVPDKVRDYAQGARDPLLQEQLA
ncbi:hypothetical protein FI667_g4734, partial [Globisporangium splendens]